MGMARYDRGVTFQVCVPFASSVFAAGAFKDWSDMANPFATELECRGNQRANSEFFA
jgi:hypothetical protein